MAGYQKLRVRASIDYPALSIAVAAKIDPVDRVEWIRIVVSALGARPHLVGGLERFAGRRFDDGLASEVSQVAYRQCHPLTNINVDSAWRREMVPVFVRRAFARAQLSGSGYFEKETAQRTSDLPPQPDSLTRPPR